MNEDLRPILDVHERKIREEIAAEMLAAIEESIAAVTKDLRVFTAVAPDGNQVSIPPERVQGILELITHEFKKTQQFNYIEAAETKAARAFEKAEEWRNQFEALACKKFPVLNEGYPDCPSYVPWVTMERFNQQVFRNHEQSLQRLVERGGLDPTEIYFIVQNKAYDHNEPDLIRKGIDTVQRLNGTDLNWKKQLDEARFHHAEAHSDCDIT